MSADFVRFTVKVLPPKNDPARNESGEQAQSLAIGARTSETFEELRLKLTKRYNARHNPDGVREIWIGELRDKHDADIFAEDAVGSLYDSTPPGESHVLFARLVGAGAGHGAVSATAVRMQGAKRRASDEDVGEGAETAKRRKLQAKMDGRTGDVTSQRVDEDGFKIPKTKDRTSGAVLVQDSQPGDAAGAGSALLRLQQRKGLSSSSPAAHSSPAADATSGNTAKGQANPKTGSSRKVFPTPDSREWQRPDVETPGEPASNAHKVSSWFKRRTPMTARSVPQTSATQDDPIEDVEQGADASRPTERVPSSSQPECIHAVSGDTPSQNHKANPVQKTKAGDKHRTPSAQRSNSGQTHSSNPQSSSLANRNSLRSVANGWTKEEDDLLLKGMSSRKGVTAAEVLKKHGIKRSASAARSRHRLLLNSLGDGKNGTINFPSSSLATELSDDDDDDDDDDGENQQARGKRTFKYWTQQDIGDLRKAMGEGLEAREIQAKYFDGRSEEAIMAKMREVQQSVYNLERRRDSFPRDIISSQLWTHHHSLKLKRAYREGLNVVAAASRYFKTMPTQLVEHNMVAYRRQMEDLAVEKSQREQSLPDAGVVVQYIAGVDGAEDTEMTGAQEEARLNEDSPADNDDTAQKQDDIDAEILRDLEEIDCSDPTDDGPVVQDSYEVGSAAAIPSSPPIMRKPNGRYSPDVVIPVEEQDDVRQARRESAADQQTQLRKSAISGGQTQLNFQRDKGKRAVRPAVNIGELDRQYNNPSEDKKQIKHEVITVSSDEEASSEYASEESDVESSQPLPQLDGNSSSTVKYKPLNRDLQHDPPSEADSDSNYTVSSGEPSRQLNLELEQSMSAAELSTQSQPAQDARPRSSSSVEALDKKPIAYVHIPGLRRGNGGSRVQQAQWHESEDEEPAFQTQDPGTTLSQKRKKPSPRNDAKGEKSQEAKSTAETSEDGSQGFQTQDPSTTLSQKQKHLSKAEPGRKATSMLRDAVERFDASQKHAEQSVRSAPDGAELLFTKFKPASSASIKPRRNVYDVPVSSQARASTQSQRSGDLLSRSSSERRKPGQLPRILGPASRLAQRKKDAEAKAAARKAERMAMSSEQSQSVTPVGRQDEDEVEDTARDDFPTVDQSRIHSALSSASPQETVLDFAQPRYGFPIVKQSQIRPALSSQSPDAGETELHSVQAPQPEEAFVAAINEDHSLGATSISQVQAEPVVEPPYPQILSREPGPNGKLEVGRPGFSWKAPRDCQYLRSDEQILALATREATGDRNVKRRAEDIKLSDQQQIAMCCLDHSKLKKLHKLERRYRRERRVEDGLPPSRGPARVHWVPGMPKPIQWDVNVMPDSDDSMSSRNRDIDEIDEEMAEEEEERAGMLDDESNEAYFDREREVVEVEGTEDGGPERLGEAQEEPDEQNVGSGSDEEESDEEPADDSVDVKAVESGMAEDANSESDGEDIDGMGDKTMGAELASDHSVKVSDAEQALNERNEREVVATAPSNSMSMVDGLPAAAFVGDDEHGEEDDNELPTAPPLPSDDAMDISPPGPSDRELQDLVQSGEGDVRSPQQGALAFTATRSSPSLGSSVVGYPTLPLHEEGALHDHSLAPTTSFNPINPDVTDENTAEYYRCRNASPDRNPELTDSMIPPWPSSGKVRASLERSPTNTPSKSTDQNTNMACQKGHAEVDAAGQDSKKR